MTQFVTSTIADMKQGRQNWRVMAFFTVPAFVISIAATLVRF